MSRHPIFDSIQQLLSEGDTGRALKTLIAHLGQDPALADVLRACRVMEANYNAVKQQEIKGILEFSEAQREYARINDSLLSLLENLSSGHQPPVMGQKGTGDGRKKSPLLAWLIGGGILLVMGLLAGIFLIRNKKPVSDASPTIEAPKQESFDCPEFKEGKFKVMILPFQNLAEEKRKPELSIQSRIRELTTNNKLPTEVEILSGKQFDSTPELDDATALGKKCMADMVIWGQFEPLEQNAITIDISYAFTEENWPPGIARQTFKNVSEIKNGKMKISNLDEAVFRICTALALHENRLDLAQKWLNRLEKPNPREQGWKKMLNQQK